MEPGRVTLAVSGSVAAVTFDRPSVHNAMSPAMYAQLRQCLEAIRTDPDIAAVTLRGSGGHAFVAGSDIGHFKDMTARERFESDRALDETIDALETLAVPTIALLEGWVMGAGLVMACACDIRIATPEARFGVPIARTLGNCLSSANTVRLLANFGVGITKRLLLLAETIGAELAATHGFLHSIVPSERLQERAGELCATLATHAPLTLSASKENIRRSLHELVAPDEDLVRRCYGSKDFEEGIVGFLSKKPARWRFR